MNYTPSAFKSPEVAIEEIPNFYKVQPTLPEITPELKATIARMCAKAAVKVTSSQKNILEKDEQYGMERQSDVTESPNWNKFVDAVYQCEDLLELDYQVFSKTYNFIKLCHRPHLIKRHASHVFNRASLTKHFSDFCCKLFK